MQLRQFGLSILKSLIWLYLVVAPAAAFPSGQLQLVVPARATCESKKASIDFALGRCFEVPKKHGRIPVYEECPEGTFLEDRYCIGKIESEPELACPRTFELNDALQCVKAEAFIPHHQVCPEGFKRTRRGPPPASLTCVKLVYEEPIAAFREELSLYELTCPPEFRMHYRKGVTHGNCGDDADFSCWEEEVEQATSVARGAVLQHGSLSKARKKASKLICRRLLIVPPLREELCPAHAYFAPTLNACVSLKVASPANQCPWPDRRPGPRKGDLYTPRFYEEDGRCVAYKLPARFPQCPPGWELVGGEAHPECYQKVFFPIRYDCDNAPGFILQVVDNVPACVFNASMDYFVHNPAPYSARASADTKLLLKGATDEDLLRAAMVLGRAQAGGSFDADEDAHVAEWLGLYSSSSSDADDSAAGPGIWFENEVTPWRGGDEEEGDDNALTILTTRRGRPFRTSALSGREQDHAATVRGGNPFGTRLSSFGGFSVHKSPF